MSGGRWSAEARAALGERNRITKRKFPIGYGANSRLYVIWRDMNFRCYQLCHEAQARYAAKGIEVCQEWRQPGGYAAFCSWSLANGYADDLQIDRAENSDGYCPNNCRWVTARVQQRNRDNNLSPVTAFGETKMLVEWAEDPRCAVTYRRLWNRLDVGIAPEEAISAKRLRPRRAPMGVGTRAKISAAAKLRDMPRDPQTGQFLGGAQ